MRTWLRAVLLILLFAVIILLAYVAFSLLFVGWTTSPQPSYFAMDNATVDNSTQITIYLHAINVDNTRSFNITTVYVDGSPNVSLTPSFGIISKNIVQKFIITGIGVNWADGNVHVIRFFSSDGYVNDFIISK